MTIRNAMVLAAGLGTRLKPVTDFIPKPLVKIAGKPMIDYALEALSEAGVTTVVVNVHHFAEQMEAHLEHLRQKCEAVLPIGNAENKESEHFHEKCEAVLGPEMRKNKESEHFGDSEIDGNALAHERRLKILISDERDGLLESGGGLARGLKLLDTSPVLVMNADLFWIGEKPGEKSNLTRLGEFFDPDRMDMALLCVGLENTSGHNGRIDFGMDEAGHLTRWGQGPITPVGKPVVYAGAMVMNPGLLDDAPEGAFNLNIYFDRAIAKGRLFGMMMSGHWITVGTPEAIGEAEAVIARLATGERM